MKLLQRGSRGAPVEQWQHFLRGQGYGLVADGDFGPKTHEATLRFQAKHRLRMDGIVGGRTVAAALKLGYGLVEIPGDSWPAPPTNLRPLKGNAERRRLYGAFDYEPAPTDKNPEKIKILGNWVRTHIVTVEVPQLARIRRRPQVRIHEAIAHSFVELWQAWDDAGLCDRILTWNGSFVPRFVRGSTQTLSNHAWGTAFDLNARWNKLGAVPALRGEHGSVRELVKIAGAHGYYWGGHYRRRLDGMHFEIGVKT